MKKQIISLMLSASILTVSPLVAMDPPEDSPHKTGVKQTPPIDGDGNTMDENYLQHLKQLYRKSCIKSFEHSSGASTVAHIISPSCVKLNQQIAKAYQNQGKPFEKRKDIE